MSTCWPARNPAQFSGRRRNVLTVGVSTPIASTLACCQTSLAGWMGRSKGSAKGSVRPSIAREALLAPRIAIHVVAAQFPEAGFVALGELQAVHPLRRFPEIEMRHEKARRS